MMWQGKGNFSNLKYLPIHPVRSYMIFSPFIILIKHVIVDGSDEPVYHGHLIHLTKVTKCT